MSTHKPIIGVPKGDDKKTGLHKVFDFTKGGSDILDPKMEFYKIKTKCMTRTLMRSGQGSYECINNFCHDPAKENTFKCLEDLV